VGVGGATALGVRQSWPVSAARAFWAIGAAMRTLSPRAWWCVESEGAAPPPLFLGADAYARSQAIGGRQVLARQHPERTSQGAPCCNPLGTDTTRTRPVDKRATRRLPRPVTSAAVLTCAVRRQLARRGGHGRGFTDSLTDFRVGIAAGAIGEAIDLGVTCQDIGQFRPPGARHGLHLQRLLELEFARCSSWRKISLKSIFLPVYFRPHHAARCEMDALIPELARLVAEAREGREEALGPLLET